MQAGTLLIIYLLLGIAVAVADYLAARRSRPLASTCRAAIAILFWPLFLPVVLAGRQAANSNEPSPSHIPRDAMTAAIAQVEAELDQAVASLEGWAENVLEHERARLAELREAWSAQAARIREMDQVLSRTFGTDSPSRSVCEPGSSGEPNDRQTQCMAARRKNLARLARVRQQAYDDLMGTLAWVRELVSMIHLARFTGAPAARAEELIAQIAAAVEGLSAVTWSENATSPADHWTPAQPINGGQSKEPSYVTATDALEK